MVNMYVADGACPLAVMYLGTGRANIWSEVLLDLIRVQ